MKAPLLLLTLAMLSSGCTSPDDAPPAPTDAPNETATVTNAADEPTSPPAPEPLVDSCFVQIEVGVGAPEQGVDSAYMHCPFSKLTSNLSGYGRAIVEVLWQDASPGISRVHSALVNADCNQGNPLAPCALTEQWTPPGDVARFEVDASFLDAHAESDLKAYTSAEGAMAQQAVHIWITLFPDGVVPPEKYSAVEN